MIWEVRLLGKFGLMYLIIYNQLFAVTSSGLDVLLSWFALSRVWFPNIPRSGSTFPNYLNSLICNNFLLYSFIFLYQCNLISLLYTYCVKIYKENSSKY